MTLPAREEIFALAAIAGPVLTGLLTGYLTWRFKSAAESRRGFQALIEANDKFRDAMFREVERKEALIQHLASENDTLRREINKLRKK